MTDTNEFLTRHSEDLHQESLTPDTRPNPIRPLRKQSASLSQLVFDAVCEAVLSKHFMPGDKVSESSLAQQFNVSKTPVREALLQLQHAGLVEPDGVRGARIVGPSAQRISDAYEVREALEVQAAQLSAKRASPEDIKNITEYAEASLTCAIDGDIGGFRAWDRQFHKAVSSASNNSQLSQLVQNSIILTWTLRLRDTPLADDSRECAQQHKCISKYIANSKPLDAGLAMAEHIRTIKNVVLSAFTVTTVQSDI